MSELDTSGAAGNYPGPRLSAATCREAAIPADVHGWCMRGWGSVVLRRDRMQGAHDPRKVSVWRRASPELMQAPILPACSLDLLDPMVSVVDLLGEVVLHRGLGPVDQIEPRIAHLRQVFRNDTGDGVAYRLVSPPGLRHPRDRTPAPARRDLAVRRLGRRAARLRARAGGFPGARGGSAATGGALPVKKRGAVAVS